MEPECPYGSSGIRCSKSCIWWNPCFEFCEIKHKDDMIEGLHKTCGKYGNIIHRLKQEIEEKDNQIGIMQGFLDTYKEDNGLLENHVRKLQDTISAYEERMGVLRNRNYEKKAKIERLQDSIDSLYVIIGNYEKKVSDIDQQNAKESYNCVQGSKECYRVVLSEILGGVRVETIVKCEYWDERFKKCTLPEKGE